jgi:hypothetical protein
MAMLEQWANVRGRHGAMGALLVGLVTREVWDRRVLVMIEERVWWWWWW